MKHTWLECNCNEGHCPVCAGGLGICTVCGGAEGTLASECPGFELDEYVLDAIYKGGLDYIFGTWIVLPKNNSKNKFACMIEKYKREESNK
jgi:hypothetical protein